MPKQKTKKIVTKRFRITKTGKVLHRTQGMRHIRRNKTKSRQRRQDAMRSLSHPKQKAMIKSLVNQ